MSLFERKGDRFRNLTCTVDMKLSKKPRYSSFSEEILTSVEKIVQGRGHSDESDPKYKFSSFPEEKHCK